MKSLRLLILSPIIFCCALNVSAQTGVSIDMTYGAEAGLSKSGVTGVRFDEVEGSPYLYESWLPGVAKLNDGNSYKDLLLKYDLINKRLIFRYSMKDSAQAFAIPPVEFVLSVPEITGSLNFRNGFAAADGGDKNTFYQVLSQGSVKLLKRVKKSIQQSHSDMNSNLVSRTIIESTGYYIVKGDMPILIKNDKKSILNVLNDKAPELQKYIADNKLDMKRDDDLRQLMDYYNQLKKA